MNILSNKNSKRNLNPLREVKQKELSTEELNAIIIDSIQDIKGKKILKIDLRKLEEAPTEFFIIAEGDSNTQVKAISDNIYRRLKDECYLMPNHIEGQRNAIWVLLDYFTIVVHIFHKETREFYQLEDLWSDGEFTEYQNI